MNTERGNVLIIVIGLALVLFIIGFFNSERSFWGAVNYKTVLRLPCGVTVNNPKLDEGEKVSFPLFVDGYVNGCGWDIATPAGGSRIAGTAQVFDGKGLPVTAPLGLIISESSIEMPFYFSNTLSLINAPTTDTGQLLLRSNTGLLYSVPVQF